MKEIQPIPMKDINTELLGQLEQFRKEMLQLVALPLHFLQEPKEETPAAVEEILFIAVRPLPDLDLPVLDLEEFRQPRQVFSLPGNDRTPLTRLPVPATNRRLSQLMRRHNR